jgi:hypothetical protein
LRRFQDTYKTDASSKNWVQSATRIAFFQMSIFGKKVGGPTFYFPFCEHLKKKQCQYADLIANMFFWTGEVNSKKISETISTLKRVGLHPKHALRFFKCRFSEKVGRPLACFPNYAFENVRIQIMITISFVNVF